MKLRFTEKIHQVGDAYTFIFDLLEPVGWLAGQSIRIELPAGWGTEERRFTISSAPFERQIAITTRVSGSDFKQALATLQAGQVVDAYDIRGDFIWGEGRPVLCANSMGITPYMAMLGQRKHEGKPLAATLLYAFDASRPLFVDNLKFLGHGNPGLRLVFIAGRRLEVTDILPWAHGKDVYIAGPSAMVEGLAAALQTQGIGEGQIKSDWFTGRAGWDK